MVKMVTMLVICAMCAVSGTNCQRRKEAKKDKRQVSVTVDRRVAMRVLSESVLEPGAAPRRLLRYKPLPTWEGELKVQARAELTETVDGQKKPPVQLPSITTAYRLKWSGTDIAVSARPATVASGGDEETKTARQLLTRYDKYLVGAEAIVPNTDRGILGQRPVVPATGTRTREALAAMANAVVVLPEVPVGVGAKWQISRAVPRATTNVKQTVTYELVEMRGDRLTIAVSSKTTGERQPLSPPGLPPGAAAELLALRVAHTGRLVVDLNRPVVLRGELIRTDSVHTQAKRMSQLLSDYFSESKSTVTLSTPTAP